jgi:hypothetical protein
LFNNESELTKTILFPSAVEAPNPEPTDPEGLKNKNAMATVKMPSQT